MVEPQRASFVALFHQVHDQLRQEINGLDANALNWVPVAGANSISTIVTHLVGSEAETLLSVAGLPYEHDRGPSSLVGTSRYARWPNCLTKPTGSSPP